MSLLGMSSREMDVWVHQETRARRQSVALLRMGESQVQLMCPSVEAERKVNDRQRNCGYHDSTDEFQKHTVERKNPDSKQDIRYAHPMKVRDKQN